MGILAKYKLATGSNYCDQVGILLGKKIETWSVNREGRVASCNDGRLQDTPNQRK